jgi:hypothetical protein
MNVLIREDDGDFSFSVVYSLTFLQNFVRHSLKLSEGIVNSLELYPVIFKNFCFPLVNVFD